METQDTGGVLATKAVEIQDKGGVLATKAVETQDKGGVLATKAVETQDKGGVLCEWTCSIADRSFPSTRRPWFSRTLTMHLLTISSCCDESDTASLVEASESIEPAPEPGGSACCYWKPCGTQRNHPAQGRTGRRLFALEHLSDLDQRGEDRLHLVDHRFVLPDLLVVLRG